MSAFQVEVIKLHGVRGCVKRILLAVVALCVDVALGMNGFMFDRLGIFWYYLHTD